MSETIKSLSDLKRSDLAHIGAHLSEYESLVRAEAGREVRSYFERTLVFIAAREVATARGDKFRQGDYAESLGFGKSTGSAWAFLALAVEKGIDPDGSERDAARWAYITQHRNSDVRSALSAPNARTLLDRLMKGESLPEDPDTDKVTGSEDETEETETREAQPRVSDKFSAVVAAVMGAADMLKVTGDEALVAPPEQGDLARLEGAIADLSAAHAAWSEAMRESQTPTTAGRRRGAVAVAG